MATPPGVGIRRKGPKTLPKLPLSAFSPPNSGTSEKFPLPPSPSTVHPESVIDAHIAVSNVDSLDQWKQQTGQVLGGRIGGVVISVPSSLEVTDLKSSNLHQLILSAMIPFNLNGEAPEPLPFEADIPFKISRLTVFTRFSDLSVRNLRKALEFGRPVDLDLQAAMTDEVFESIEDMLSKATAELEKVPPIIISNWLPPPDDLELPIVKLMNHPSYRAFQARTAALSLFPDVFIKFLPPEWNTVTPGAEGPEQQDSKEKKEWKRRIKMYLGPVMEAFGYQRIIFGSSPAGTTQANSSAGDWYSIARESLAELGVEQEAIDLVFCNTAKSVYL